MKLVRQAGLAAAAAVLLAALTAPAGARTLQVGAGEYPSISRALEHTEPGDTVRVGPGTYREHIVVDTPGVTLSAAGEDVVIENSGTTHTVQLKAENTALRGFTIRGSGTDMINNPSAVYTSASGVEVTGNRITGVRFGIYLESGRDHLVRDNYVRGEPGLSAGNRGYGIYLWSTDESRIIGNEITGTLDGVYYDHANKVMMRDCEIYGVRYSIHYMYSDNNEFVENYFHNNKSGAAIMYSDYIEFRGNRFEENRRDFRSFGVKLLKSEFITATDNTFVNNTSGVEMQDSFHTEFRNNLFLDNDIGVSSYSDNRDVLFTDNDFIGHFTPVMPISGKIPEVRWSADGRGNYWSEYSGVDFDGDGVGDTEYRLAGLFEKLQERLPLTRIFLLSAAADALAAAERNFPVIQSDPPIDSDPLMRRATEIKPGRPGAHKRAPGLALALLVLAAGLSAGGFLGTRSDSR